MEDLLQLRENCIGISYNVGVLRNWHFGHIIGTILGVPEDLVVGIDTRGNDKFIFQVSTVDCYDYICETFTGRDIPIGNDCIIQVDDISSRGTRVMISCVPFSITNDQLSSMFSQYGDVYKCQNHFRIFGKYRNLSKTGDRVIWMNIRGNIPQSVRINKTDIAAMRVQYQNQPMSCNKCGHSHHRARQCTRESKDFINVIDITHQDDDNDMDAVVSLNLVNISANDLDVHIEPSQTNTLLQCAQCDYQCKYQHILDAHMETHNGEKPLASKICNLVEEAKSASKENNSPIDLDQLFKCTECEVFSCNTYNELLKHLKSHNIYACDKCDYKSNSINGLNGHAKIHNHKKLDCSKCGFKGASLLSFSNHMKTHLDDISPISPNENDYQNSQSAKRAYSLSPDKTDENKNLRQNTSKKTKK